MNPRTSSASRGVPAPGILPVPRSSSLAPRRALTLVEMLISMAITLVMMAAVVNLFANIGANVKIRRATMEMSGELRMMRAVLFNDLAGATCRALPWQRPDEDPGYIEIIEGEYSDRYPSQLLTAGGTPDVDRINRSTSFVPSSNLPLGANEVTDGSGLGDYDDILALTVRSENAPFRGRAGNTTIESNLAEVIWYAVENPADGTLGEPGMRTVYRRVLLIAPWVSLPPLSSFSGAEDRERLLDYYSKWDVSARVVRTNSGTPPRELLPNTLGDLTKRENRFGHNPVPGFFGGDPDATSPPPPDAFPHVLFQNAIRRQTYDTIAPPPASDGSLRPFGLPFDLFSESRVGEDVMLSNVLAFDVRVFDPGAPLFSNAGTILEPSDVGWGLLAGTPAPVGFGAFVDLYWINIALWSNTPTLRNWTALITDPVPLFGGVPHAKSMLNFTGAANALRSAVYDTWSFHYEHDGLDQDDTSQNDNVNDFDPTTGLRDEGTNGLDDVPPGDGVDDILERETSPPYPVPLRGMQVKLRIYEPDTRQIREATVTRSFVPQ